MEWQPIETAPRDGTWLLLASREQPAPTVAQWKWNGWYLLNDREEDVPMTGFDFWMVCPLPQAERPKGA